MHAWLPEQRVRIVPREYRLICEHVRQAESHTDHKDALSVHKR